MSCSGRLTNRHLAKIGPAGEPGGTEFHSRLIDGTFPDYKQIIPKEALKGTKLYVPHSRLPAREEDEWYHADLIGLAAVDGEGAAIGTVIAVHNFGAGDLLEIRPASGGATALMPFTRETVPEVDVEGGWLRVVPP